MRFEGYRYALDVTSGKIVSGKKRVQAAQRFLRELELSEKPDYPWRFDPELASRPVAFMERFLRPTKGDYDRMRLLPWQKFVEGNLYGWVSKKTGFRRFREGIVLVASGNGKSTLLNGNAIFALCKDGERGAECYCIANGKDQAKVIFDECKAEVENSPLLKKHIRTTRDGIYYDAASSKLQALPSDAATLDGKNVHLAIFDEVQDYRDYSFINRLKKKIIKRRQPLILYISTMGNVIDGPLMDLYVIGGKILQGDPAISPRASERVFVYIDEIDENDDVEDTANWGKANPSLGTLLHLEDLIDDWERCKLTPATRSDWINKQLNVFTKVNELSFLDPEVIERADAAFDPELLEKRPCFGGFDLSTTEDFTASALEFPMEKELWIIEHSWVPERKVKADNEKLDWGHLVEMGWLTVVPGDFVRYELVRDWFLEMREKYDIRSVGYDPAKAYRLVQELTDKGLPMSVVRQGELTLTAPLDDLKEKYLDGLVRHNGNRMLRWYLGNVKLSRRSAGGTYLPTKQNRYRKIDGFAALLDAHTENLRNLPKTPAAITGPVARVIKLPGR